MVCRRTSVLATELSQLPFWRMANEDIFQIISNEIACRYNTKTNLSKHLANLRRCDEVACSTKHISVHVVALKDTTFVEENNNGFLDYKWADFVK